MSLYICPEPQGVDSLTPTALWMILTEYSVEVQWCENSFPLVGGTDNGDVVSPLWKK